MNKQTKYLIVLGDGMADYPDSKGLTPLVEANKPFIDALAAKSELGLVQTVPDGFAPGSDVANLSVMGYCPKTYYTGRSPLEAVSAGVKLNKDDICYRLNFVTLSEDNNFNNKTMLDYSGGEIETKEAAMLIELLKPHLPTNFELYLGTNYRHILVEREGAKRPQAMSVIFPPHDITDRQINNYLPYEPLLSFVKKANEVLNTSKKNKSKANAAWIWGKGTVATLTSFKEKFNKLGAVISEVDLIKGIGISAGLTNIEVEGANGTLNTNYKGMVEAATSAFFNHDFVYLHIEAPDECGHKGDREGKIKAIECLDSKVVKPLVENLSQKFHLRLLFLPDHATPLALKTHTSDAVPYLLYDSENLINSTQKTYTENSAKLANIIKTNGSNLIKKLFEI